MFLCLCHNSNETMVSIASSLLPDGFVELMIIDGNTKNMDSASNFVETEGGESMENSTPDDIFIHQQIHLNGLCLLGLGHYLQQLSLKPTSNMTTAF